MVERETVNFVVAGSSPATPVTLYKIMKFKAKVFIRLRENVSDAAGNAVRANVARVADIRNCTRLRLGKLIEIEFEAPDEDHANRELAKASDLLFANTVVEDWECELKEVIE